MKSHLTIRKLLCIVCTLLIFIVNNSFIYEMNAAFGKTSEASPSEASFSGEQKEALSGRDASAYAELAADGEDTLEWIEDSEVSTLQERSDYGVVEEDQTFTLDDVMGAGGDETTVSETAVSDNALLDAGDALEITDFDKEDWKLVLINKQHSIPEDYAFTLGTIKGSMKCDERILPELTLLLQEAKEDGINLVICSPYRDYDRQIVLFNRKIKAYMKKKLSYMEAYRLTAQAVTVPGASEHQIGLALDIICDTYSSLNEGFGETEAGKWLARNSYKYGFILRYPSGKEDITGIEYEPWHFRYVGRSAARYMYEHALTLEEFVSLLP